MLMARKTKELKIYIDPFGNTLNLWWDDPSKSWISEEVPEPLTVIVKDKHNRSIGLKKIGFFPKKLKPLKLLKFPVQLYLEAHRLLPHNKRT